MGTVNTRVPIKTNTFSSRSKLAEPFVSFLLTDFHQTATCRISTFCFAARKCLHFMEKRRQQVLKDEHSHISLEVVSWSWFSVGSFRATRISALFVESLGISSGIQAFHNSRDNRNIRQKSPSAFFCPIYMVLI